MKKIIFFSLAISILCTIPSCEKKITDSEEIKKDDVVIVPSETVVESTSNLDTEITTESQTAPTTEKIPEVAVPPQSLPDVISDKQNEVQADAFNYTNFIGSQYDSLVLIALDDNYVYLEKHIGEMSDYSDLAFYKYNLSTGETTEFNGIVPGFNTKSGDTAFVDGKIYSVMYNNVDIVHYSLDTQTNTAEIIQKDDNTDSQMRTTLSVGKDSYMEIWATGNGYNQTAHVMLFDKSGSKEIITKKYNSGKERLVYTSGGDHIYEYAQTPDKTEPYLNIYNENGNLESAVCLKEIADELERDPDSYVSDIHVSGRFIAFDMNFGESTAKSYIYDMEKKSFYLMDGCQSLTTPNYLPPDFGKIPFLLRDTSGERTMFDLFCLYENGDIVKLVDNIGTNTMIIPNGGKIAYFNDDNELYTVEY